MSDARHMSDTRPHTERVNAATRGLDALPTQDVVALLLQDGASVAAAVAERAVEIAAAVDGIVARLERGGRLHYVGAGTSGRLGMLDAAECPPTFGTDPALVVAHIAGGEAALVRAVEGAEDDALAGEREGNTIGRDDAVVAISASGGAPYVVAAAAAARARGALTIALTNAEGSPLERVCERAIVVVVGPEPIAGSTRMKAGTAQKLVLNTLSTVTMVRLGRVYDNLMVDVVATNAKLHARAVHLVRELTGVDADGARSLLDAAGGSVKTAVVCARRGVDATAARQLLDSAHGRLREVLDVSPRDWASGKWSEFRKASDLGRDRDAMEIAFESARQASIRAERGDREARYLAIQFVAMAARAAYDGRLFEESAALHRIASDDLSAVKREGPINIGTWDVALDKLGGRLSELRAALDRIKSKEISQRHGES